MKKSRRNTRPTLERLETRELLYAVSGIEWPHPQRITVSFAPDGTTIGSMDAPSNLYAALPTGWQDLVHKAAAAWNAVANIQMAFVPDNGTPADFSDTNINPGQGGNSVGDIRIFGKSTNWGSTELGQGAYPYVSAGGGAGDIFINTAATWTTYGNNVLYETFLHELGHTLGLDHSSVNTAVMWPYNQGVTTLQPDDIAGVQSIYGAITHDSDFSFSTLTLTGNTAAVQGTISDISDLDKFQVTAPTGTNGTLTVQLQSTDFSTLQPLVAVYDSSSNLVGSATSTNYGDTLVVKVTSGVSAGQVYRIVVASNSTAYQAPGSAGAYGLSVNFGTSANVKAGAATFSSGVELVAAAGLDGGIRAATYNTATNTATWFNVGAPSGVTFTSDPQVVASSSNFPGGVWVKGSDGQAWFNGFSGTSFWGWASVGNPTTGIAGDLMIEANPSYGGVYVYAFGNDGHAYEEWTPDAIHWYGWADLGNSGSALVGNPTGYMDQYGNQYLWGRNANQNLTQVWYSTYSHAWYSADLGHGSAPLAGSPSAAPPSASQQEIFCVDVNGNSEIFLWNGSAWAIGSLGNPGVALVNDPSVSPLAGGYNTYFEGVDHNYYAEWFWNGNWYWGGLGSPHGGYAGSPTAVTEGTAQTVFGLGVDGQLYSNRWTGSTWILTTALGDGNSSLGGNPFILPDTFFKGNYSTVQTSFDTIAPVKTVTPEARRPVVLITPDLPHGPQEAFPLTPARRIRQALEKGRRFTV